MSSLLHIPFNLSDMLTDVLQIRQSHQHRRLQRRDHAFRPRIRTRRQCRPRNRSQVPRTHQSPIPLDLLLGSLDPGRSLRCSGNAGSDHSLETRPLGPRCLVLHSGRQTSRRFKGLGPSEVHLRSHGLERPRDRRLERCPCTGQMSHRSHRLRRPMDLFANRPDQRLL